MPEKCPDCNGSGHRASWIDRVECTLCHGLGIIIVDDPFPYYRTHQATTDEVEQLNKTNPKKEKS